MPRNNTDFQFFSNQTEVVSTVTVLTELLTLITLVKPVAVFASESNTVHSTAYEPVFTGLNVRAEVLHARSENLTSLTSEKSVAFTLSNSSFVPIFTQPSA